MKFFSNEEIDIFKKKFNLPHEYGLVQSEVKSHSHLIESGALKIFKK